MALAGNPPASSGSKLLAIAALVGAMASVSVGAAFGKSLFPVLGPSGAVFCRAAFAALILMAALRPWRHPLTRADAFAVVRYGAVLGIMNLLFYHALATLPLGVAVAIEFLGPLSVALFASRRPIDLLWVSFAAAGVLLLSPFASGAGKVDLRGVVFALGAGVCWGLYILMGRKTAHLHGGRTVASGMAMAAAVIAPFGARAALPALASPTLLVSALGLAVFSSVIPYLLEMAALKRLSVLTFGVTLSLEPAMGALAGLAVIGERLDLLQWVAIALVMLASAGAATQARAAPAGID